MNRFVSSVWIGLLCFAALDLVTGCQSRSDGPPPEGIASVRPVIALRGEASFFEGRVGAVLTIGRGRRFHGGSPVTHGNGGGRPHHRRPADEGFSETGGGVRPLSRPPVTLEVSLRNLADAPVDVEIREVNSALGNFAVRPEHLLLAPDAASALDPMVSQLADVGDDVPVTVSLRLAGKTETQVITMHTVETARDIGERP
jgi:hypothetical protein